MNGYIDIHCHCLPGVDDGAANIEETRRMLELAYKDGVRGIIVTPHFHYRRGHPEKEQILSVLEEVQELAGKWCPDLALYPGQELYYSSDLPEHLGQQRVCTMNRSNYVLVEFSPGEDYLTLRNGLNQIQSAGYWPILAHVERYQCMRKERDRVGEVSDMGVLIQANASSVQGNQGFGTKRFLKKLLDQDLIDVIASDAHDAKTRIPQLQQCFWYVEKYHGIEAARRMFIRMPGQIIKGT